MNAHVDMLGANGNALGNVASQIITNGRLNVGAMRPFIDENDGLPYMTVYKGGDVTDKNSWSTQRINTNATLRRDEWKQLDQTLLDVSRQRLGGIDDLTSRGLVYNLGNAMGTTVLEYHTISDGLEAVVSMDGVTRGKNDRVVYNTHYLPIPIIHVDYEINARELAASRSLGNPLDTTHVELAVRRCKEKLEYMLFGNYTFNFGEKDSNNRNTIYSYTTHPDRNQVTLTKGWDESGKTPAMIVADVVAMKQAAMNDFHFGPYMLYVPTGYELILDNDYDVSGASMQTIRERIKKIEGIIDIKVNDTLAQDNVLLVQMTSDVVRLVNGLGLQNVEWDVEGKFITKYKVLTIQVPQIRSDQNKRSGIVQLA